MGSRLPINGHALAAFGLCLLVLVAGCLSVRTSVGGAVTSSSPRAAAPEGVEQPGDVRFPVDGPSIALAREIAAQHWGAAPCSGQVTIEWTPLDGRTNATASWRNPTDAWNNPAENFDCRVRFNPDAGWSWPKLCTIVVHELGHLLGRPHAEDNNDVMSPMYLRPLPRCTEVADPAAAPPAPVAEPPAGTNADEAIAVGAGTSATRSAKPRALPSRAKRARGAAYRRAALCRTMRRMIGARRAARSRLRCGAPRGTRRPLRRR